MSDFLSRALFGEAGAINDAIERLEHDFPVFDWNPGVVVLGFEFLKSDRLDFRVFWPRVKEINEQIAHSGLPREKRQVFRDRISRLCERAKEVQTEQTREFNDQWHETYDDIVNGIGDLRRDYDFCAFAEFAGNHEDIRAFRDAYQTIRQTLIGLACMSRDQKERKQRLFEELNTLRELADDRIDLFFAEKRRRHDEWVTRTEERRDRLNGARDAKERLISNVKAQIDDLEDKIADAWSDSYRDRVQGWLDEKTTFLAELEEQIEEIDAKLSEIEARLHS